MEFLAVVLGKKEKLSSNIAKAVQTLFTGPNSKLLGEYEVRLNYLNQLNSKLIAQCKSYLTDSMHNAILQGQQDKLAQLKEDDIVLSQFLLEDQTKQSVFEWIRDFKDYEIREGLQNKIKDLVKLVELRDGEIMEL